LLTDPGDLERNMNGLPVIDLSLARKHRDSASLLKATKTVLLAPLLHVMGEMTEYRANVAVDMGLKLRRPRKDATRLDIPKGHCPFRDRVLQAAGYNPFEDYEAADLPLPRHTLTDENGKALGSSIPFKLWGNSAPCGMYKRVYYALRDYSRDYCQTSGGKMRVSKATKATKSASKGKKGGIPLFVNLGSVGKTGRWALTEAGVAMAARVRTAFQTDNRNVTACWLDGQLNHQDLFNRMQRALAQDSRMAKERSNEAILDHLQTFFLTRIRRNAFAVRLGNGELPTFRQLLDWCVRNSISTFRKFAQEPLTRESRNALTKRERVLGVRGTDAMAASPYTVVSLTADDEGSASHGVRKGRIGSAPVTDVVDPSAVEKMEHRIAWNQGLERVRDAVRRHKPGNPERYVNIFDAMCDGISQEGLAMREGVSKNRAATLMADTRTALRKARQVGIQARIILSYIREEPWATLEDLQEDLDGDMPLAFLLVELVKKGRLKGRNGSFCITQGGETFLDHWDVSPTFENFGHQVSL
jgi:hypothetical protein